MSSSLAMTAALWLAATPAVATPAAPGAAPAPALSVETSHVAASASPEGGAEGGPVVELTQEASLARGATHAPSVAVEAAPRAAVMEAGRVANPVVIVPPRLTVEAGRRSGSFGAGTEGRVQVLQDLALARVGARRETAAHAALRAVDANVAQARLEGALRAALAWVDVLEAQEGLDMRQRSLVEMDELVRLARARVQSGAGQPRELQQALGERGTAQALLLDAEGRLFEARSELRFATGLGEGTTLVAVGDLARTRAPAPDASAPLPPVAEDHPALGASRAHAVAVRAEEHLVAATRAPSVSVGASFVREGGLDKVWTVVAAVPLPFGDFGAFDRARQRASAEQAEANIELVRRQLGRELALAEHERLHAREVRDALESGARGPLSEAVRLARAQYQAGTSDVSSVLMMRQRLVDAEERLLRASADVQRADLRWMRARGTLLEGIGP